MKGVFLTVASRRIDCGEVRVHASRRYADGGVEQRRTRVVDVAWPHQPLRYTKRLAEAGIEPSAGSVGNSCDNALAQTIIGLYKTEVIRLHVP